MGPQTETTVDEVEYPASDGKPMAETDLHRDQMVHAIRTLRGVFADRPDVYVTGNLMVYYEKGNGRRHRSPDVMVVFGVPKGNRETYKVWEEGRFPDFILEITSTSTQGEDTDEKYLIYRNVWKVREYFLFDPLGEYLGPSLQGHRLVGGEYQPIPAEDGQLTSEVLGGVRLDREGMRLVFRAPGTGRVLLPPDEEKARQAELARELAETKARFAEGGRWLAEVGRDAAVAAAQEAAARLNRVEAELDRLRAELDALRKTPPAS